MNDHHLPGLTFLERLAVAMLVRSPRTSLVMVKEHDALEVFVAARTTVVERDTQRSELLMQVTRCVAEPEPPFRHHVEAREFLRQDERVALRQDDDPRGERDRRRVCGDVGERHRRVQHRHAGRRR